MKNTYLTIVVLIAMCTGSQIQAMGASGARSRLGTTAREAAELYRLRQLQKAAEAAGETTGTAAGRGAMTPYGAGRVSMMPVRKPVSMGTGYFAGSSMGTVSRPMTDNRFAGPSAGTRSMYTPVKSVFSDMDMSSKGLSDLGETKPGIITRADTAGTALSKLEREFEKLENIRRQAEAEERVASLKYYELRDNIERSENPDQAMKIADQALADWRSVGSKVRGYEKQLGSLYEEINKERYQQELRDPQSETSHYEEDVMRRMGVESDVSGDGWGREKISTAHAGNATLRELKGELKRVEMLKNQKDHAAQAAKDAYYEQLDQAKALQGEERARAMNFVTNAESNWMAALKDKQRHADEIQRLSQEIQNWRFARERMYPRSPLSVYDEDISRQME